MGNQLRGGHHPRSTCSRFRENDEGYKKRAIESQCWLPQHIQLCAQYPKYLLTVKWLFSYTILSTAFRLIL